MARIKFNRAAETRDLSGSAERIRWLKGVVVEEAQAAKEIVLAGELVVDPYGKLV